MRLTIVVEAIPPYCGGGEQVAWVQAVEMARNHDVAVVTFGNARSYFSRDGVHVFTLPERRRNLAAYSTVDRAMLNSCIDEFSPTVIHCHMPNVLSACIRKKNRLMVSTIHDGVPENEMFGEKYSTRSKWLKFKLVRRINVRKSDALTCVSRFNHDVMTTIYNRHAEKFSFIPNPIAERFFSPPAQRDEGFILNFGRQIDLKMGALLPVAREMPTTKFVFVGTGDMVRDHGLPNVHFVGFTEAVEDYIDAASLCVFPSRSENFPLVGLEAMARGKAVIATRRGFSEYIRHMDNGVLLDSTETVIVGQAISMLMGDKDLRARIGWNARSTAENYCPAKVVAQYEALFRSLADASRVQLHSPHN